MGLKVSLFMDDLSSNRKELLLGSFDIDVPSKAITSKAFLEEVTFDAGSYCIGAKIEDDETQTEVPCFSYLELEAPLHHDIIVDIYDEELYKLTFSYNEHHLGIIPIIREVTTGPTAPAIKLKKVTKTYADKKVNRDEGTAQFAEDDEIVEKTWIQKNWKMLVIGLVLYNLIVNRPGGGDKKEE